jgi:hypothetical protein
MNYALFPLASAANAQSTQFSIPICQMSQLSFISLIQVSKTGDLSETGDVSQTGILVKLGILVGLEIQAAGLRRHLV